MRVILDTNVLLGALISPYRPRLDLPRLARIAFELVTSLEQLDELRRVSRYPKLKAILRPPHWNHGQQHAARPGAADAAAIAGGRAKPLTPTIPSCSRWQWRARPTTW